MTKLTDLTGKKFGTFKVISRGKNFYGNSDNRTVWIIRCSCGNTQSVIARNLVRNHDRICGKCFIGDSAGFDSNTIYSKKQLQYRKAMAIQNGWTEDESRR